MLASEIAKELDYELVGDDIDITGIARIEDAGTGDIAVAEKKSDINKTEAKIILTKPVIQMTEKSLLITYESIECAMVKVCGILIKNKLIVDYSIPVKYQLNDRGYYVGKNCMISSSAVIQPNAMIEDNVIIGDNCIIEPFAVIKSGTVIENDVHIAAGSRIGEDSFYHYYNDGCIKQFCGCGIVRIKHHTHIGCNTVIQRGTISDTIIGVNCMIGNFIDIGHDVQIGDGCKIVSQSGIAGNAKLKDNVLMYGQSGIKNNVTVGRNVIIKARTCVSKSVGDNQIVYGTFGRDYSNEMKYIAKIRKFFERKDE